LPVDFSGCHAKDWSRNTRHQNEAILEEFEQRKQSWGIRKWSASLLDRRRFSWVELVQQHPPKARDTDGQERNKIMTRRMLRKTVDRRVWPTASLVAIDLPVRLGQLFKCQK
jgi:hypothetical protein